MCTSLWQCRRVATRLVVQVLCALETKFWSVTVSEVLEQHPEFAWRPSGKKGMHITWGVRGVDCR